MFALINRGLRRARGRVRIMSVVLGLILVHVFEIWLFAIAYYLSEMANVGALAGPHGSVLYDHVYYSASVYTTVGFGDIVPVGTFKLLTGIEGLIGLVMITWSASFTFLEMQAIWSDGPQDGSGR